MAMSEGGTSARATRAAKREQATGGQHAESESERCGERCSERCGERCEGKFPLPPKYPEAQGDASERARFAAKGNLREVASALRHPDACVNGRDCSLWTPLHYAAMRGCAHCVEYLVDLGAHLDARNNLGDSPLDIAIAHFGRKNVDHEVTQYLTSICAPRGAGRRSRLPVSRNWTDENASDAGVQESRDRGDNIHRDACFGCLGPSTRTGADPPLTPDGLELVPATTEARKCAGVDAT